MIDVIQRARESANSAFDRIYSESKKKKGSGRLLYLIRQIGSLQGVIHSPILKFNYELKYKIISLIESDMIHSITEYEFEESYKAFKAEFSRYQELLANDDDTDQNKQITDSILFPEEIVSIARKKGISRIEEISVSDLIEEITSIGYLEQLLSDYLAEEIIALSITKEEFDELAQNFQGRFFWLGNGKRLAFLLHQLEEKGWIAYPNKDGKKVSSTMKATIALAHFHVNTRKRGLGNELTVSTMKDYLDNAKYDNYTEIKMGQSPPDQVP